MKTTNLDFLKKLKKYNSVNDLLSKNELVINKNDIDIIKTLDRSTKGFIYEKIWDICIKFGLVKKLTLNNNVEHYIDNINNKQTKIKIKDYIDQYLNEKLISGNSSGYSDISFSTINDKKELKEIRISVKYFDKEKNIDTYDIQKICTLITDENDVKFDILLFIKNKADFINKANKANKSSNLLIKYISPNGKYENIYDINDLEIYFNNLKKLLELYNYLETDNDIKEFKKEYLGKTKEIFKTRFHQELFINKISDLINNKKQDKILVGAVPRSGKTYIMAGAILDYVKNHIDKQNKFIIITPAPTETISQYNDVFKDYLDFDKYNIKAIEIKKSINEFKFKEEKSKENIVYIISKQRLGYPEQKKEDIYPLLDFKENIDVEKRVISNIKKYFGENELFDLILLDEAHFGMATYQAKIIIDILNSNKKTPKIYVTATYNKPNEVYNIPDENKIIWDINDIELLKKLSIKNNDTSTINELFKRFEKIFGLNVLKKTLKNYNWNFNYKEYKNIIIQESDNNKNIIQTIADQYKHFPKPFLITTVWDNYDTIYNELKNASGTNFSFDMDKLFSVKDNKFVNEEQVEELLYYYFGYPRKKIIINENEVDINYSKQLFYKERGILPRIQRICNNNCRTLQFPDHHTSQLWFLPYGPGRKIEPTIIALLNLLKKNFQKIFKDNIFIVCTNKNKDLRTAFSSNEDKENIIFQESNDIKQDIKDAEELVKKKGKKNLIILTAAKLQLGISLNNVDIVALFNNITSSDAIYQMMFRSMTEIDDNFECKENNYCSNKKYGFIVDLNPQRTILLANYMINELSSDTKKKEKIYNYNLITNLLNIDRDIFTNKYEDDNDIEKFSKELFNKMSKDYNEKTSNIKSLINDFIFNIDEISKINIKELFITKKKGKIELYKEGIDHKSKKIKDKSSSSSSKKEEEIINDSEKIKEILSEVISISSILSSNYEIDNIEDCIFKKINNYNEFKYKLKEIIKNIKSDEILKSIFIDTLNDRFLNNIIESEKLFTIINIIIE